MIWALTYGVRALLRLRAYEPQRVTPGVLWRWLRQFPSRYRADLLQLLGHVQFISESETIRALIDLNDDILARLAADGVSIDHVVYVELDSAGSSSGVMLNMLRDHSNLERRGAHFVHSKDVTGLQQLTRDLDRGALIYVDDFAGTGRQFLRNRKHAATYVVGTFSEFFIGVCVCEEARLRMEQVGVVPAAAFWHPRSERPLDPSSSLLREGQRTSLLGLSAEIHPNGGLGFGGLATSIVLYRNAPNSTPLLLRGNLGQAPFRGVLPRFDDL